MPFTRPWKATLDRFTRAYTPGNSRALARDAGVNCSSRPTPRSQQYSMGRDAGHQHCTFLHLTRAGKTEVGLNVRGQLIWISASLNFRNWHTVNQTYSLAGADQCVTMTRKHIPLAGFGSWLRIDGHGSMIAQHHTRPSFQCHQLTYYQTG